MGVWIETIYQTLIINILKSHPVWVCGLKLDLFSVEAFKNESHPVWVCGLKLNTMLNNRANILSHPVWVCGLKHPLRPVYHSGHSVTPCMGVWIETSSSARYCRYFASHPVWVCGLKHTKWSAVCKGVTVTPCMGVWIETSDISQPP